MLILSAGARGQSGFGPDAIARFQRQAVLMEESWRRLQFDRYNTPATATHAWEPMGRAIRAYLEPFATWRGREADLRRSLTTLLRTGMPALSGDPARNVQATEVWSVGSSRPMVVVSVTAAYLVGPVGQRFPRTARCSFLVWKDGATYAQPLAALSLGGGWFYGKAARSGDELVFAGGFGARDASRPAYLVYRLIGTEWSLIKRGTFDGRGSCHLRSDGTLVVESAKERGMVFASFRGQRLHRTEAFRRGPAGYVSVGARIAPNEFSTAERFCTSLQARERAGLDPNLARIALEAGLGEPYPMWFAVPESGGTWTFTRMRDRTATVRLRARFAGRGEGLRLASLERLR